MNEFKHRRKDIKYNIANNPLPIIGELKEKSDPNILNVQEKLRKCVQELNEKNIEKIQQTYLNNGLFVLFLLLLALSSFFYIRTKELERQVIKYQNDITMLSKENSIYIKIIIKRIKL